MVPESPLTLESQALLEISRFFSGQPTPEEIFSFHISPELTERLYALVDAEKAAGRLMKNAVNLIASKRWNTSLLG